jgi:hypothetical protein
VGHGDGTTSGQEQVTRLLGMISLKPKTIAIWASLLLLGSLLLLPSTLDRDPSPLDPRFRPIPKPLHSLLVVGDSLSISLGEQLERHFDKYSDQVAFQRRGKVSSGLARPEFFDWEQNLEELVSNHCPDIVVIMIGANDNKPLNRDNRSIAFGTSAWRHEYTARLQRLYDICGRGNPQMRLFWVGAPIMADPLLTHELKTINRIIESWCRTQPACKYVGTWSTLTDHEGQFTQYVPDDKTGEPAMIRTKDGVHLAPHGSRLLAKVTIDAIRKYYSFE